MQAQHKVDDLGLARVSIVVKSGSDLHGTPNMDGGRV